MTPDIIMQIGRSVAAFMDRETLERFLDFHLFEGRDDMANGFVRVHNHSHEQVSVTFILFDESAKVREEVAVLMKWLAVETNVDYGFAVIGEPTLIERL